ncbi:MAG: hypothetical protein RIA63_01785 [Cyclobacteriaceae bacterium]
MPSIITGDDNAKRLEKLRCSLHGGQPLSSNREGVAELHTQKQVGAKIRLLSNFRCTQKIFHSSLLSASTRNQLIAISAEEPFMRPSSISMKINTSLMKPFDVLRFNLRLESNDKPNLKVL